MNEQSSFYRRVSGGLELFVRLTPKSSRDAVEGVETASDGRAHLKARVRAVPEKGKANQALVKLIASTLGVPARDVEIVSGDTARLKTVRVSGDPESLEESVRGLSA
ncbi:MULTISPECIES: DUF167 domain-containing protein [unclassified Aminobacter]|uniref:DUF167 domain-containing protein n=1 Tax=unclassified Aminobacter TaxID=2644704 RepID=UPI00046707C1|nr:MULTISPECIES: DUF167 domain-containing protein [unclassified Aminobacter]TWG50023.1 hypothetical protein L610_000600000270 [Aminobacter sp. J44]TWH35449.1 hypothetical protein L611_001300000780 [Aminobacter sp. J15]